MNRAWSRLPPISRRLIVAAGLLVFWQAYVSLAHVPSLLFASPLATAQAIVTDLRSGILESVTLRTLELLLAGIAIGVLLGVLLAGFAVLSGIGQDLLRVLSAVFNPLPAIAVLPLAMLWFGLTPKSIIFVVTLATVWPVAINTESGFRTLSQTLRMVAANLGLRGPRLVVDVLLPGALPQLLTGAKTAWAFGWRTVVAAELVFGVAGVKGGLGRYISDASTYLDTARLFAGLVAISVLGLLVEAIFNAVESATVVRWGMSQATETPAMRQRAEPEAA